MVDRWPLDMVLANSINMQDQLSAPASEVLTLTCIILIIRLPEAFIEANKRNVIERLKRT